MFLPTALPRYVRVNLIKTSVDEVINSFVDKGWTLLHVPTDFSRYCIQNNNHRYKPQPKCKDPLTLIACMRRK